MNININDDILHKYLAGNATVFEKVALKEWLKLPENENHFFEVLYHWEQQHPQFTPDVEKALAAHFDRMNITRCAADEQVLVRKLVWSRWAVAASMVLLIVLGWLNQDLIKYQTYQTDFGQTQTFQLSDGSLVTLNANSSLRVPRFGFGQRTREVFLQGEAEFSVVHTSNHQQFIVKTTRHFDVLVLGTEFAVYSRERGAKVLLNKGKVQLRYQQGKVAKEVVMKPGDLVLIDPQDQLIQTVVPEPEKFVAWKEHRFVFDETSLQEITHLFSEQFGIQVVIEEDSLTTWTVSGSFTARTADELLESLTEAAGLHYQTEGSKTTIYAKRDTSN